MSKNIILKKRLWKQTIWEFLIPILFNFILSFAKNMQANYRIYLIALSIPTAFQATCRFILM